MKTCQGKILILHGWGSSSGSWNKVEESLNSLGYSVIIPDLPGFGQEPEPLKPWDVDDYMNWVEQFCVKNNLNNFLLLGHSFGGRVAIKFTAKYPEKVKKLILYSAAGVTPRPKTRLSLLRLFSKAANIILSLPILNLLKKPLRKGFYSLLGTRDYYFLSSRIMLETFKKVIEEDLSFLLGKISVSTFIVWGEKDMLTPVQDAKLMNKEIPGSTLKIIPNGSHYLHTREPKKLVEAIKEFL
ncbi:alpha/beta hydrolase, partial [Patescibacteria group bacterium]|nr:alpha/beta hydrolase [Patescibacteria group bacterium]